MVNGNLHLIRSHIRNPEADTVDQTVRAVQLRFNPVIPFRQTVRQRQKYAEYVLTGGERLRAVHFILLFRQQPNDSGYTLLLNPFQKFCTRIVGIHRNRDTLFLRTAVELKFQRIIDIIISLILIKSTPRSIYGGNSQTLAPDRQRNLPRHISRFPVIVGPAAVLQFIKCLELYSV